MIYLKCKETGEQIIAQVWTHPGTNLPYINIPGENKRIHKDEWNESYSYKYIVASTSDEVRKVLDGFVLNELQL